MPSLPIVPFLLNIQFQEMKQRFEMLYRQFQDLERFNKQFVPRDEVTEAMQAVLNEVGNGSLHFDDLNHSGTY